MRRARDLAVSAFVLGRRARLIFSLLAAVFVLQLLPHPPGVSPVGAMALFATAALRSRAAGFAASLGAFALAGVAIGLATGNWEIAFHRLAPAVYGSWALSVLLGWWLRDRRTAACIAGASVAGSLLFFGITNFAVWLVYDTYPRDAPGLIACYVAGLPLLARGALADLAYAGGLFGALALAERRAPALRERPTTA
jgi:hypothetical protein